MTRPLDAAYAIELLRREALIGSGSAPTVNELGGGVSSRVLDVLAGADRFVLKQPLPKFRVRDEWIVSEERADVEAAYAQRMRATGLVPRLRHYERPDRVLVFDHAPPGFGPWKQRLLQGDVDPRLGDRAGDMLATLHDAGLHEAERADFDRPTLFEQQRIDPYLRTTARRHPDLAGPLEATIAHLQADRGALIHGDFSPKNLLTDGKRLLLVDHEVASRNDPGFDVAFFTNHLLLKAAHRPRDAPAFLDTARRFLERYEARVERPALPRLAWSSRILAGLLLARIDGKSPVEYLDEPTRGRVRLAARHRVRAPPATLEKWLEDWPPS